MRRLYGIILLAALFIMSSCQINVSGSEDDKAITISGVPNEVPADDYGSFGFTLSISGNSSSEYVDWTAEDARGEIMDSGYSFLVSDGDTDTETVYLDEEDMIGTVTITATLRGGTASDTATLQLLPGYTYFDLTFPDDTLGNSVSSTDVADTWVLSNMQAGDTVTLDLDSGDGVDAYLFNSSGSIEDSYTSGSGDIVLDVTGGLGAYYLYVYYDSTWGSATFDVLLD